MQPRLMMKDEIEAVAALWHDTWHSAHDHLFPQALCEFRTKDFFRRRVDNERETVRVFGAPGKPIGLCIVSHAHLDQLYVAPSERGKGVGERLLADAEARMRESGITEANLYVALGNEGAFRFYERHSWIDAGKVEKVLEVTNGSITILVCKMLKGL